MRLRQYTLTPRDVEQCASTLLQDHVKIKDHGPKLRALVPIQVVVRAACRLVSIHAVCKRLAKGPSDDRAAALVVHFESPWRHGVYLPVQSGVALFTSSPLLATTGRARQFATEPE